MARRDKWVAAALALLLGGLGLHKFYLGKTKTGVIYLLLCWTMIPALVALVDGIVLLFKSRTEFDALYNTDPGIDPPADPSGKMRCPECREAIWADAKRCRFCGVQLTQAAA